MNRNFLRSLISPERIGRRKKFDPINSRACPWLSRERKDLKDFVWEEINERKKMEN